MPGQILGDRYEVEKQLGKKSGRWTLLARDLTTDTPVILKLLFMDDEMHQDDLKLFIREVETLQTIEHPSAPRYLGYFEIELFEGKALALIQSYIDGISLAQYLKKGRLLSEEEAIKVARAILKILVYLHNLQPPIVHRDIKPSNILITRQTDDSPSRVCLVDFGSVKSISGSGLDATSFTLVGTDGYMPPEQMGRRAVRASDLYSLGVTLVAGMTGQEPEELPHRGLKLDLDQISTFDTLSNLLFKDWLKQIIEPEVVKRFQSAEEALQGLG